MTHFVLDASAILRMTDAGPGANRVRDLFQSAARGESELFISAVNWGEIVYALHKRSPKQAPLLQNNLSALPMEVVGVDKGGAEDAALLKNTFQLPYADAFAAALARTLSVSGREPATLVTADYDFKALPKGTLKIEFLPAK